MTAVIQSVIVNSGIRRRDKLPSPQKMSARVVKLTLNGLLNGKTDSRDVIECANFDRK